MSYPSSEIQISPSLSKLLEPVELIIFLSEAQKIFSLEISLILDIAYLKKRVKINEFSFEKFENSLRISILKLPLENEEENNLLNVGVLEIKALDEGKIEVKEYKLIVQILKEKGVLMKNII